VKLIYHGPASTVEEPDTKNPTTWRWYTRLADLVAVVQEDGEAFRVRVILPKETIDESFTSAVDAFDLVHAILSDRGEIRPRRRL
jgi:hypothetical protein